MKTNHIVALVVCLVGLQSFAQLPNSNFQNWGTTSVSQDSAHHWSSTNLAVHNITTVVTTLVKGTGASKNSFAADLNTAPFGFVQTPIVGILVNGKAKLDFDAVRTSYVSGGGTPISANPLALEGYYTINGPYDGLVTVLVSKYNSSTSQRDTVALNSMNLSSFATTTTSFSLPITYSSPGITGDSVTVVFHASDPAVVPGINCLFSTLSIDSVHLVESVVDGSIAQISSVKNNDTVNTAQHFEAMVKNLGSVAISNFDLSYTVNGGTAITETFIGTIAAGASAKHTFSQSWAPTTAGDYNLCVYLDGIPNDIVVLNDTVCLNLRSNLSLKNHQPLVMEMFPNPATDQFTIHLEEKAGLLIVDQMGKLVEARPAAREFSINTSRYPSGMYHIRLNDPSSNATLKSVPLIVKH